MKLDQFLLNYHQWVCSDYGEAEFAAIRTLCPGLSSPKLGKILNHAGRLLDPGEIYAEIGTFTGYTLISAAHANSNNKFLGIDNMKLLGETTKKQAQDWVRQRLLINMEHFKFGNYSFIEDDYKNIKNMDSKIGVFLIDGHHTREEAYDNFKWAHPFLADRALILIDDITIAGVGEGVKDWVKENENEYEEFFRMNIYHPSDNVDHWNPAFWNGLSMVAFNRKKE